MLGKFTATGGDGRDRTMELSRFIEMTELESLVPGRYSFLLVLALFGGHMSGRLSPESVVREIRALEGIGPPSQLKAPIQNKHPPLKGLWHKHYFGDGIVPIAANVLKGLGRFGIPYAQQKVDEAKQTGVMGFFTAEDAKAIADDVVHGHLQRLRQKQELTGEWLVFARHEGRNYYLCLATHDTASHVDLRRQIDTVCCQEFPFLAQLLREA